MEEKEYVVAEILEDYRADFLMRECRSIRSLRSEIGQLKRHFGLTPVTEITIRSLRHYQAERRAQGKSAATVNKELAVLSAAMKVAASNEIIHATPPFPRRLRPAPPRKGFLEHGDYEAIRKELPEWGRPVIDFGYYSGWRRNEILGLRREEVDLAAHWVRLDERHSKNGEARGIPLKDFGFLAIETALQRRNELGFVFARAGKRISNTVWHVCWRRAAEASGRAELKFHDLRRTVVRRLELGGVSRKLAMAWVGHKTESIYRRYAITVERDLTVAADQMLSHLDRQITQAKVIPLFPAAARK